MEVHSTILCYILPGLFGEPWLIQVQKILSNVDCLHPGQQSTVHSENLSVNHYNCKNFVLHAKNKNKSLTEQTKIIRKHISDIR